MKKFTMVVIVLVYNFLGGNMLFASTTLNPFTFTDRMNLALSTEFKSNAITASGIDAAAANISITGGIYTSAKGGDSNEIL